MARRSGFSCTGCGCGAVALLLLGGAFFGWRWYEAASYVPPADSVVVDTSPEGVRAARKSVQTFTKTVAAARADAKKGKARSYKAVLKQSDLNTLIRTDPKIKKELKLRGVERPTIEIKDGRMKAGALVSYIKQPMYVTAEGRVEKGADGKLRFTPSAVYLGKNEAPVAVNEKVAALLTRAISEGALKLPGEVKAVKLENGQLVIEGNTGKGAVSAPPSRSP